MSRQEANKRSRTIRTRPVPDEHLTHRATSSISWLRVPAEREVPDEVKGLWRKAEDKLGFVPNIMRAFALRPDHFLGWWRYYDHLLRGESSLSKIQREMIAVVVSSANRCHY